MNLANQLPFHVAYALLALFYNSTFVRDELAYKKQWEEFKAIILMFSKTDAKALEHTLFDLFRAIDRDSAIRTIQALENIFERKKEQLDSDLELYQAKNIKEIRRVILTPTRAILLQPLPIMQSRFIKESDPEFTIRLQLRDDNFNGLNFTVCNQGGNKEGQLSFPKNVHTRETCSRNHNWESII